MTTDQICGFTMMWTFHWKMTSSVCVENRREREWWVIHTDMCVPYNIGHRMTFFCDHIYATTLFLYIIRGKTNFHDEKEIKRVKANFKRWHTLPYTIPSNVLSISCQQWRKDCQFFFPLLWNFLWLPIPEFWCKWI